MLKKKTNYVTLQSISIIDVSELTRFDYISLYDCNKIVDISPLSHIYSLSIKYCHNIRNMETLTNVLILHVSKYIVLFEKLNEDE